MTPRVLFYVQHLLGVGHVKRAAALVRALTGKGALVTVAMGGFPVTLADFGAAKVVQLPPVRTADMTFKSLLDDQDQPVTQNWWDNRRDALLKLGSRITPNVLLVEHYPFGRKAFRTELEPLLDRLAGKARIACSVRDVLVAKDDAVKNRKIADMVLRRFNRVLVHGDPTVIPFEATFPEADRFQDRIAYTGYITDAAGGVADQQGNDADGGKQIVVSTGGGAVGDILLRAALEASRLPGLSNAHWRLLAGDNLDQSVFKNLQAEAPRHVVVEPARPDFQALLRTADLSISQGGYNTVMDIISAGCRNLIVPFAEDGESEQTYRATCFEKRGLVKRYQGAQVTGGGLVEMATRILELPKPPGASGLDMNGAARSAELIIELAGAKV